MYQNLRFIGNWLIQSDRVFHLDVDMREEKKMFLHPVPEFAHAMVISNVHPI